MACSVADFRVRFPEFVDDAMYPDARIQLFLGDAVALYLGSDEPRWGGKYDIAHCFVAAHLLYVATSSQVGSPTSQAGPITSKTADGVTVTRSSPATMTRSEMALFFSSTSYGQQFTVIRNRCFAGVLTACR